MYGLSTAAIVVIVVAVLIVFKGVVIVHQGYEYTVERLGRFIRSLQSNDGNVTKAIKNVYGTEANMMARQFLATLPSKK